MNTPFRKLIRIAIVLISLIILFNFFGYFLVRSKSEENEKKTAMVRLAERQRMLSQTIIKDGVLILSISEKEASTEILRKELKHDIEEFSNNGKILRGDIALPGFGNIRNNFRGNKHSCKVANLHQQPGSSRP